MNTSEETQEERDQYSRFIANLTNEITGTESMYARLAEQCFERYPLLNRSIISLEINKLMIYYHVASALSVCHVDELSSQTYMHETVNLLMKRIHDYATVMAEREEEADEGKEDGNE